MEIKNKVAIVTGASMGIGKATAELLSKLGAKVVLAARSRAAIESLAKTLPDSLAVVTDMTDTKSIENLVEETMRRYGRIDILINNAGRGLYGAIENVKLSEYQEIWKLNVEGPLYAMQKVVPLMRAVGGGAIINISSMLSKMYRPYLGGYSSTKFALNSLSLTAREELEKDGIVVSVVLPTLTETEFGKNAYKADEIAQTFTPRNQAGRPPADTAEYIAQRIVLAIETGKAEVYAHDHMEPQTPKV